MTRKIRLPRITVRGGLGDDVAAAAGAPADENADDCRRAVTQKQDACARSPMQPGFNFEPLTPTAFLHRAAQVFPGSGRRCRRQPQVHLRRVSRSFAQICRGAESAWRPTGRSRRHPGRKFPCDACRALCRAVLRARYLSRSTPASRPRTWRSSSSMPAHRCSSTIRSSPRPRSTPAAPGRARHCGWCAPAATADELEAHDRGGQALPPSGDWTSARCWPSTTRAGPPRGPRASCTTIAAPTCRRWPWRCTWGLTAIRSICGRCRCFIATAGASRGP